MMLRLLFLLAAMFLMPYWAVTSVWKAITAPFRWIASKFRRKDDDE